MNITKFKTAGKTEFPGVVGKVYQKNTNKNSGQNDFSGVLKLLIPNGLGFQSLETVPSNSDLISQIFFEKSQSKISYKQIINENKLDNKTHSSLTNTQNDNDDSKVKQQNKSITIQKFNKNETKAGHADFLKMGQNAKIDKPLDNEVNDNIDQMGNISKSILSNLMKNETKNEKQIDILNATKKIPDNNISKNLNDFQFPQKNQNVSSKQISEINPLTILSGNQADNILPDNDIIIIDYIGDFVSESQDLNKNQNFAFSNVVTKNSGNKEKLINIPGKDYSSLIKKSDKNFAGENKVSNDMLQLDKPKKINLDNKNSHYNYEILNDVIFQNDNELDNTEQNKTEIEFNPNDAIEKNSLNSINDKFKAIDLNVAKNNNSYIEIKSNIKNLSITNFSNNNIDSIKNNQESKNINIKVPKPQSNSKPSQITDILQRIEGNTDLIDNDKNKHAKYPKLVNGINFDKIDSKNEISSIKNHFPTINSSKSSTLSENELKFMEKFEKILSPSIFKDINIKSLKITGKDAKSDIKNDNSVITKNTKTINEKLITGETDKSSDLKISFTIKDIISENKTIINNEIKEKVKIKIDTNYNSNTNHVSHKSSLPQNKNLMNSGISTNDNIKLKISSDEIKPVIPAIKSDNSTNISQTIQILFNDAKSKSEIQSMPSTNKFIVTENQNPFEKSISNLNNTHNQYEANEDKNLTQKNANISRMYNNETNESINPNKKQDVTKNNLTNSSKFNISSDKYSTFNVNSISNSNSSANLIHNSLNQINTGTYGNIKYEELANTTYNIIKNLPDNTLYTAKLLLKPESLGTVFVKMEMSSGVLQLKIEAETKDVVKNIENQVSLLRDKLFQQGIKTESINVTLRDEGSTEPNKQGLDDSNARRKNMEDNKNLKDFISSFKYLNSAEDENVRSLFTSGRK